MLLLLGAVFVGCNDDVTPPIPVIKEFELTVLDKADVPISKAVVNVFMSHKPDVLVMSKNTDIFTQMPKDCRGCIVKHHAGHMEHSSNHVDGMLR